MTQTAARSADNGRKPRRLLLTALTATAGVASGSKEADTSASAAKVLDLDTCTRWHASESERAESEREAGSLRYEARLFVKSAERSRWRGGGLSARSRLCPGLARPRDRVTARVEALNWPGRP